MHVEIRQHGSRLEVQFPDRDVKYLVSPHHVFIVYMGKQWGPDWELAEIELDTEDDQLHEDLTHLCQWPLEKVQDQIVERIRASPSWQYAKIPRQNGNQ